MSSEMKSKVLAMISYGYSLRHPLSREILSSIYDMSPCRGLILLLLCSLIGNRNFPSKTKHHDRWMTHSVVLACFRSPPLEAMVPNAADISLALQPASANAACSARTADRSLESDILFLKHHSKILRQSSNQGWGVSAIQ